MIHYLGICTRRAKNNLCVCPTEWEAMQLRRHFQQGRVQSMSTLPCVMHDDSSWYVITQDSTPRLNWPRSLFRWCKGTRRGIGKREFAVCGAKPSHRRLENLEVKRHHSCLCTTVRQTMEYAHTFSKTQSKHYKPTRESSTSSMLTILSVSQRGTVAPAQCWQFWAFPKKGKQHQLNADNFERFPMRESRTSSMPTILTVSQRRKAAPARCWQFWAFPKAESSTSSMLTILSVSQRGTAAPAQCWQFWAFSREGQQHQLNADNILAYLQFYSQSVTYFLQLLNDCRPKCHQCWWNISRIATIITEKIKIFFTKLNFLQISQWKLLNFQTNVLEKLNEVRKKFKTKTRS